MADGYWLMANTRLFDRQALALISVIFLTETAITVVFTIFQQYPAQLLGLNGAYADQHDLLLRRSAAYAGYALSAYGAAKLPSQPLCGWLADRFGARRVLILGLLACVLAILVMAQAPAVGFLVVMAALFGTAIAVVWPSVYALIGDAYHASTRGRILAAISGAQLAGSAAGFGVGAFVIDYGSYLLAFGLAAGLNAVALFLALTQAQDVTLRREHRRAPQTEEEPARAATLRTLLHGNLIILCSILALISIAIALLVPDLKPYSSSILHLRYSTFTVLLAIPAGVAVLTLLPSGSITDTFGRSLPMLVAAVLWPLCIVALTFTDRVPLVLAFASMAAFAYALGLPAWSASLIDVSSAGSRGLQVGIASSVQAIGLALGPAIGGEVVLRLGTLAPFRLSAGLMLLAALLTVAYRARTHHLYQAPAEPVT